LLQVANTCMNCDVISKHQFLTMLLLLALLVPAAAQHISLQLEHALDGARFTPAGRISGNLEVDEVHRLLVLLTLRLAALPMVASCRLAYAHCIFKAMHLAMHNKTGLLQLVLATRLAQRSFNGPVCCLLLAVSTYILSVSRQDGGLAALALQRDALSASEEAAFAKAVEGNGCGPTCTGLLLLFMLAT